MDMTGAGNRDIMVSDVSGRRPAALAYREVQSAKEIKTKMYKEVAKLILYRDLGEDSILRRLAGIFEDYENGVGTKAELTTRIYEQMKALLDLATLMALTKICGIII